MAPIAILLDRSDAATIALLAAQPLPQAETIALAAIQHAERRAEITARRQALHLAVQRITGTAPDRLQRGGNGNLLPINALHVSLASRGRWIALAFGRSPLGIDVETLITDDALPRAALHPDEVQALRALAAQDRALAAARLWAAKESWWKCCAMPLHRDPRSYCVALTDNGFAVRDPEAPDALGWTWTCGPAAIALAGGAAPAP